MLRLTLVKYADRKHVSKARKLAFAMCSTQEFPSMILCSLDGDSQRTAGEFAQVIREQYRREVEVSTVSGLGKQLSGAREKPTAGILAGWFTDFEAKDAETRTIWCVTQGKVLKEVYGLVHDSRSQKDVPMLQVLRVELGPDGAIRPVVEAQPEREFDEPPAARPETEREARAARKEDESSARKPTRKPAPKVHAQKAPAPAHKAPVHSPANMLGDLLAPLLNGELAQHGAKRAQQKDKHRPRPPPPLPPQRQHRHQHHQPQHEPYYPYPPPGPQGWSSGPQGWPPGPQYQPGWGGGWE